MKLSKYILPLAVIGMTLSACSDDLSGTDWQPGEASTAAGVYFSPDNETYMALLDGGTDAVLKVNRISADGALSVPVVVKNADPNMVIPSEVKFEAGSLEADLVIDCANVPAIVELPLELTFADAYINPYAAGAAEYKGSVLVSKWENVSETGLTDFQVTTWNYTDAGFDIMQAPMYHLLGSNRYRIDNFLGTDVHFTFELVKSPYNDKNYRVIPVTNQLLLSDYGWGDYSYYNSWWLVLDDFDADDEEAEGWPNVVLTKPNGATTTIYYLQFLWYDDGTSTDYCYVLNYEKGTPTAYMAFYGNLDEDMETYSAYYRLRFSWKE